MVANSFGREITMSVWGKMAEVTADRHQYATEWKRRTGGKVVGLLCSYVPEEIIYAHGMLPVRILGDLGVQRLTDTYISDDWCPNCR